MITVPASSRPQLYVYYLVLRELNHLALVQDTTLVCYMNSIILSRIGEENTTILYIYSCTRVL